MIWIAKVIYAPSISPAALCHGFPYIIVIYQRKKFGWSPCNSRTDGTIYHCDSSAASESLISPSVSKWNSMLLFGPMSVIASLHEPFRLTLLGTFEFFWLF
jgi:hypothetical protein